MSVISTTGTAKPQPSARKRTRRVAAALAVPFVITCLLAGEYWWQGRRAEARMAAAEVALRASGRPASVEDLVPDPVPDEENPVVLLRQAAAALKPDHNPVWSVQEDRDEPLAWPLTEAEAAGLARLVAAHDETLGLVRRARLRPRAEWGLRFTRPMIEMPLRDLHDQRHVAQVLDAAVLHAHHSGDDAAALAHLDHWLSLARALHRHPTIVGHLVALGSGARASELAAQMAAELGGGSDSTGQSVKVRQRTRDFIKVLLDESAVVEGRLFALRTERVNTLDGLHSILDGKFSFGGGKHKEPQEIPWHGRPAAAKMLAKNHAVLLRHFALHEGTVAAERPAYAARVPEWPPESAGATDEYALTVTMPSVWRAMRVHYRSLAERRMAATCLAARLYSLDHGGGLPATLDDLVPDYLPSVPRDPLAPGGAPLRYVNERTDPQRPRVYSVGDNGIDHGGAEPDPDAPRSVNERTTDLVRQLKRQPRRFPATLPLGPMFPSTPQGEGAENGAPATSTTAPQKPER